MIITRALIDDAITFGRKYLPTFTVVELAKILNVDLLDALRCVDANNKFLKFDADKKLLGFNDGTEMLMSASDLWRWHVINNAGGDESKCLPAKTQTDISKLVSGRITFTKNFEHAVFTFLSEERDGANVKNQVGAKYGNDIAAFVDCLANVNGQGTVIDKYLYGVVLDGRDGVLRSAGLHPFVADAVLKQMTNTKSWNDYVVPMRECWATSLTTVIDPETAVHTQTLSSAAAVGALANATEVRGTVTLVKAVAETSAAENAPDAAPATDDGKAKRQRRTKEQLLQDRQKLVAEAIAAGVPSEAAQRAILDPERQGEAEKAAAELIEQYRTKEFDAPGQQVNPSLIPPATVIQPSAPAPIKATDIKASIRDVAGFAPAPLVVDAAPKAMAASASGVVGGGMVQAPAPVAPATASLPPATSAQAQSLLDELLGSTGQKL